MENLGYIRVEVVYYSGEGVLTYLSPVNSPYQNQLTPVQRCLSVLAIQLKITLETVSSDVTYNSFRDTFICHLSNCQLLLKALE